MSVSSALYRELITHRSVCRLALFRALTGQFPLPVCKPRCLVSSSPSGCSMRHHRNAACPGGDTLFTVLQETARARDVCSRPGSLFISILLWCPVESFCYCFLVETNNILIDFAIKAALLFLKRLTLEPDYLKFQLYHLPWRNDKFFQAQFSSP